MPTIQQLAIYPVKSCQGILVEQAQLTATGLAHDRQWMVVDEHGDFLTQRSHPRMAQIQTALKFDHLVLRAPGMLRIDIPTDVIEDDPSVLRTVRVWDDTLPAIDEGDLVATWLTNFLQTPCRLVKFYDQHTRLSSAKWTQGVASSVQFADGFALLVLSQESVDDLNVRLTAQGEHAIAWQRFRPNILVSRTDAYAEDHWDTLQFEAAQGDSEIELKIVKPCVRCPITCTDQTTGQRFVQPLQELSKYRSNARVNGGIAFAQNAIISAGVGAQLRVGQSFEASVAFD